MSEPSRQFVRTFVNAFPCSVDSQRRLAVPKLWRLPTDDEYTQFLISPGHGPCICFHTFEHFQELLARAQSAPEDEESQNFLTQTAAYSSVITLDKQGRFVIPQLLLEYTGIKDSAICAGNWTHGRILSPDVWEHIKPSLKDSLNFQNSLKTKTALTDAKISLTETK